MNLISENQIYKDFLLERDLFDFVDDLENFQSRHNKKKEYLGKKTYRKDLHILDRDKLVLIAYRRNKDKLAPEYRQQYFNLLNHYDKKKLIQEITNFRKPKKSYKF